MSLFSDLIAIKIIIIMLMPLTFILLPCARCYLCAFLWIVHFQSSKVSYDVDFFIPTSQMRTMRKKNLLKSYCFKARAALELGKAHSRAQGGWFQI